MSHFNFLAQGKKSCGDEEVASSLPLRFARLIFLRMKRRCPFCHLNIVICSKKSVSGIRSLMFPLPPSLLTVVLASFLKGERKVLDALAQANVSRNLVPDVDTVWANFFTFLMRKRSLSNMCDLFLDRSPFLGRGSLIWASLFPRAAPAVGSGLSN